MADIWDFVIVGSGGGGGIIAWLLAKAGRKVLLLEQGPNRATHLQGAQGLGPATAFDSAKHDEFGWFITKPDPVRQRRGSYNTFKDLAGGGEAVPFPNGWTASVVGGGSGVWGTWTYRALPIDFRLEKHFRAQRLGSGSQYDWLASRGYAVTNWPISYRDLVPYYDIVEALFAVSGDRDRLNKSIAESPWFKWLSAQSYFDKIGAQSDWLPSTPFPQPAYPITPVGYFVDEAMKRADCVTAPLPTSIVGPALDPAQVQSDPGYLTRDYLRSSLDRWKTSDGGLPAFWTHAIEELWSARYRQRCNLCGFCGGYLCWGAGGPKSGALTTTLLEFQDLKQDVELRPNCFVYEIATDWGKKRAKGVRYLSLSNPDAPVSTEVRAHNVIVSCGAVQSARLLLMSGERGGLGNENGQVGRNATFHLFGLTAEVVLSKDFSGRLRSELGHTGNTTSLGSYFLEDTAGLSGFPGSWWKVGTLASTARKNPLSDSGGALRSLSGNDLLDELSKHERSVQIRMTADDLSQPKNRVTLDTKYVDEHGLPVACIERQFGDHETKALFPLAKALFQKMLKPFEEKNVFDGPPSYKDAILNLVSDHQFGTCRMGDDPSTSVVDRNCQVHGWENVFVVDSSVMPSGLGLNPMLTVAANALRVGTWMTEAP